MGFQIYQQCIVVLILHLDIVKSHPCPCDCETPSKIGCTIVAKSRPDVWGPILPPFDNSVAVDIFKTALRNEGVSELELMELYIREGFRKVDQEVHYCFKFKIPPSKLFNEECEIRIQYLDATVNYVRVRSTTCPIDVYKPDGTGTSTPNPRSSSTTSSSQVILYHPYVVLFNSIFTLLSQRNVGQDS